MHQFIVRYHRMSLRTSQRPRGCRRASGEAMVWWTGCWVHFPYYRPPRNLLHVWRQTPPCMADGVEPDGCRPPPRKLLRAVFVTVRGIMGREMFGCRIRNVPEWNRAGWRRRIMRYVGRQYAGHSSALHQSLESADIFSNLATSCFGLIFSGDETRSLAYAIYSFFVS